MAVVGHGANHCAALPLPRHSASIIARAMRWTLLCRVVDNFGDVGFAWRLAADLAGRGEAVRLASTMRARWPGWRRAGAAGVEVVAWDDATRSAATCWSRPFGCGWPARIAAELAAGNGAAGLRQRRAPERRAVRRSLARPAVAALHAPTATPIPSWFFYPGFTAGTGGLLREPGLLERRQAFGDGRAWLARRGIAPGAGERCVSLFCYPERRSRRCSTRWRRRRRSSSWRPAPATERAVAALGPDDRRGPLRAVALPPLARPISTACSGRATSTSCAARIRWFARSGPARPSSGRPTCSRTARTGQGRGLARRCSSPARRPRSRGDLRRLFARLERPRRTAALPALGGIDPANGRPHSPALARPPRRPPDLTGALIAFVASKARIEGFAPRRRDRPRRLYPN